MTIKKPIDTGTGQNAESNVQHEPEINVQSEPEISVQASANEPEINVQASASSPPLAFAMALDNPPPDHNVPTAYATSVPAPVGTATNTIGASNTNCNYNVPPTATTETDAHVSPPATSQVVPGQRPPPPGAPHGGRWIVIKHVGSDTWMICAIVSLVFCWIMFFPCGVWALLCPCDQKIAYESPQGHIYDESGLRIHGARIIS